jgi:Leucine-rich repeat (LRR) protein
MDYTIFISYAMADSKKLQVSNIATQLEERDDVDKVHYWEGWHGYLDGDIISFMEDNIKSSDIFIAVCTEASNLSENCGKERRMAVFQNKRLVPLFEDFSNVPESFQPYIGINFTSKNMTTIANEIYELIIKGREEIIEAPSSLKKAIFFSKQVNLNEIQILKAIQKEINNNLKDRFKIDKNGYVTSLDFSSMTLNSIPNSIYSLKNLITANFSFDSFETDDEVKELFLDGKEILINGKMYVDGQIEERVKIDSQRRQRLKEKFRVKPEQFKVLGELQKLLIKELPKEDEIGWSDYGVKVENEEVLTLGLANCDLMRLPDDFGNLTSLNDLFVKNNKLTTLPSSIGNLKTLRRVSFKNNQLTILPDIFGNLESIRELAISENQLKVLPASIGNLKSLLSLWFYSNQLESLPESFGHLESLEKLFIYENNLISLPKSFGDLKSLQEIDLHRNQLTTIPESFGNLESLLKLNLSRNKLETLSESFCNLELLMKLDLSYNQISSLPESIGNLELLVELNLSENYSITHLPESLGKLKSLLELNLDFNGLIELPESIGNLESLRIISLIDNKLTFLPASFQNLKSLIILNLKGNKLTTIPEFLLELPNLRFLNVQNNPLDSNAEKIMQKLSVKGIKVNK